MGKQRTITLTGRRPVRIDEDAWPQIAEASGDSYTGLDQARRDQAVAQGEVDEYSLRVRAHADGRHIVYGFYTRDWRSDHDGLERAGELLAPGEPVEPAIERVGETLGVPRQVIADCIADLPAEPIL